MIQSNKPIVFRKPQDEDGLAIHQLIAANPPLDVNSVYSYYLLVKHFCDTCVVAEMDGKPIGFLSAYIPPNQPTTLFVWQVVVDAEHRGNKVAWRMLNHLLGRFDDGIDSVEATVNPSNTASRRLFERLSARHGSTLSQAEFLEASAFGEESEHESEIALRVPLNPIQLKIEESQNAYI